MANSKEGTVDYAQRFLAKYAAYTVKPELYDCHFPSLDGAFEILATMRSFFGLTDPFSGITYDLSLVDTQTKKTLFQTNTAYTLNAELYIGRESIQ